MQYYEEKHPNSEGLWVKNIYLIDPLDELILDNTIVLPYCAIKFDFLKI